jgi:UDP-2,4-diacetamido-2,4,6-trideoxy-beta-L-altropyranose hydrolase
MVIYFRCDASTFIGVGHVMRCSVLAHIFKQHGFRVVFFCTDFLGNMAEWLKRNGYEVVLIPIDNTIKINPKKHAQWLANSVETDAQYCIDKIEKKNGIMMVDHYSIESNWHQLIQPFVNKLIVIDDLADRTYSCDIIIDPTLTRKQSDYQSRLFKSVDKYFIANEGVLLRPEFSAITSNKKTDNSHRVLISMGGSDPLNSLIILCEWVKKIKLVDCISVIISSQCPHLNELQDYAEISDIQLHIDCLNIAELMSQHDWFVGAYGSTTWERMALGLAGIGIEIAANQAPLARSVEQAGCRSLGKYSELDLEKFTRLYLSAWQEYSLSKTHISATLKQQIPLNQSQVIAEYILSKRINNVIV